MSRDIENSAPVDSSAKHLWRRGWLKISTTWKRLHVALVAAVIGLIVFFWHC
jgi:hypothetical protein